MAENINSPIERVIRLNTIIDKKPPISPDHRKNDSHSGKHHKEEAGDHFRELAAAAETANKKLIEQDSPYRFFIYNENDEVYINLVLLNDDGSIKDIKAKNITHMEFEKLIVHIIEGEGLLFDTTG